MGDRITLATVPDVTTAELLSEVLTDGGIENVDVATVPANAYLGRAAAVDYAVRVDDIDEERARKVLADFESESGQAVFSQAAVEPADDPEAASPSRRPWVVWVAVAIALVMLVPLVFTASRIVLHFLHDLFTN